MDSSGRSDRSRPPEIWEPARRAAQRLISPVQRFMAVEAASGLLLVAATVAALVWANSAWRDSYAALWHAPFGLQLGPWTFVRPLHFWVNDALMTIFFFVVGLEIRRETHEGDLRDLRLAALPLAAALGGMLVPAAVFAVINIGRAGMGGWGIPMATDIAFAVGVLTLLGNRVPGSLRTMLLALAVIDDIGAIVVIAVFYSGGVSVAGLLLAAAAMAVVAGLRAIGVRTPLAYVAPAAAVWVGLLVAGIHPTLAGVLLGLATPARAWFGPSGFAEATQEHLGHVDGSDRAALHEQLAAVETARREAISPAERLLHMLHPWVAFGVMPLFALANAGVPLGGADLSGDGLFLFLGIMLGLVLGKPLGIVALSSIASRTGLAALPADTSVRGIALVGIVGGIGFTMSLFIAQLAFPPGPLLDTAKLAILLGSTAAITAGLLAGRLLPKR